MDKLISEELVRQIRLMGYDRSKTLLEQKPDNLMPGQPDNPGYIGRKAYAGNVFYQASVHNMEENEKEKNYDYLYTKWAPYVCGTETGPGASPENSFSSGCPWVKDGLTPMDICNKNIIYRDYYEPKDRKTGEKWMVNGGGVVVKKETGSVYNTYWCECKKNPEIKVVIDHYGKYAYNSWFNFSDPVGDSAKAFPKWFEINDWYEFKYCTQTTKMGEWFDKNYHDIIPIISLVLQFTGPIGMGIGALLELSDAAKYQSEGNTYAAGLATIFALIGPLDAGLGALVKKVGPELLEKVAKKSSKFTDEEIKLLQSLKDKKRVMSLVKFGTAVKFVRYIMVKINNFKVFGLFLLRLVNLGLVSFKFLSKIGLQVGGTFFTWDYIAYKYGIQNTMPLSELKNSKWKILQYLGEAGPYLQPFTTGVMSQTPEVEKIMEDANKAFLLDNRIATALEDSIKAGFSFTTKIKSTYMIDVAFIQYVLKALGFAKKITTTFYAGMSTAGLFTFNDAKNVSKVQVYEHKEIPLMMSPKAISNLPLSAQAGKLVKEWNPYNGKPISMFIPDAVKNKKKYFAIITDNLGRQKGLRLTSSFMEKLFNIKNDGNVDMTFNWGYYDDITKTAIMEYQKSNGLSVDGVAGTNTLKKLKEDAISYKKKNSKDIPNYNNIEMTEEEIEKVRLNTVKELEELKKMTDKKLLVSEEETQKAFESQKQNTVNEVTNEIEFLEDKSKVSDQDVIDLENLSKKAASSTLTVGDLK